MFFLSVMTKDYKYHIQYLKGIVKSNIKIWVPIPYVTSPMQSDIWHPLCIYKKDGWWKINPKFSFQYRAFSPASKADIFYELKNNMLDVKFLHFCNKERPFELLIVPEEVKRPGHMCNMCNFNVNNLSILPFWMALFFRY